MTAQGKTLPKDADVEGGGLKLEILNSLRISVHIKTLKMFAN